MRPFNLIEKKFLKRILECDKTNDLIYIHNILSEINIFDCNYEIEFIAFEKNQQKEIDYIVTVRRKNDYFEANRIIGTLISLCYFIDYLVENGFLVREKITDIIGYRFINKINERQNLFEYKIESQTVKGKFAKNLQYKFYATELLRELVDNNFETFEKKEAKSTRYIAIAGLLIAVGSLIVPLMKNDPVKIDTNSIDYFYEKNKPVQYSPKLNDKPKDTIK